MREHESVPTLEELEKLIGRRIAYLGHTWHIIEVLDDEMALVLQADDDSERILANSHGEPVRSLPDVINLPVVDTKSGGINPELKQITVLEEED
jgi:hypothetical protein